MTCFELKQSTRKDKKYMAIFYDENCEKIKTAHFGSAGMSDYLHHKNEERKYLYLNCHRKNEDWNDKFSAGSLSHYILWNKTTLKASVKDYMMRFNLKKY